MQRIANKPNLITHGKTPVSLWMRSDPDDEGINNDMMIRVCTRGQDLQDDDGVQDIRSSSCPVPFTLETSEGASPTFDLSVFGTPNGVSDDEIIIGKNAEDFHYTSKNKLKLFGKHQFDLATSLPSRARKRTSKAAKGKIYHVYVYMVMSTMAVQFYVVHAVDGHEMPDLAKTDVRRALKDGKLVEGWRRHRNIDMNVIPWKQAARQEMSLRESSKSPSAAAGSVQKSSGDEVKDSSDEAEDSIIAVQGRNGGKEGPPQRKKRKTSLAATSAESGRGRRQSLVL
jgi:hypothetical protein